ncbi:hypothetical protein CSC62_14085 [Pseudoxanthomonas jiangsuensis]|uniref:HI1506-related protein n=1 Tax=Pseudoxanthomonas jiangsuensis TaxID=619688 RepID=UPI00139070C1|nr:HI1506-related protein [Pseudoxanthomonas jiangsuensis]KAF1692759.1 hypothetical protein CSC62_14085 [Pseudoxanthomonas jiangsuensis]
MATQKIIVKAKPERGFYRAGLYFTREGRELDTGALTKRQLEAIRNEPNLVVVEPVETDAQRKAREKAEAQAAAEAADAAALEREQTAIAANPEAWATATKAAQVKGELDAKAWGKLPAAERVTLIEAQLAPAA